MVGFTGSRRLSPAAAAIVAQVARFFAGQPAAVGCAGGADQAVRQALPAAQVWRTAAYGGPPRAMLVKRSVALVQAVAASGPGASFVGFPAGPCPAGLVPSASPGRCFSGLGSGTWASLALAAGLGLPVSVFWCGSGPALLPAAWGAWSPVVVAGQAGWQLSPAGAQMSFL